MIKQKKRLDVRMMAGAPDLQTTAGLLQKLAGLGVTGVQLVLPFSDPMAAQGLLQEAGDRALQAGTTMGKVFQLLDSLRSDLDLEITLVTYMNPLLTYGYAAFFQSCRQAGVGSVLVVDLPYEERQELLPYSRAEGVGLVTTCAVSCPQRLARIAAEASNVIYVTGGSRGSEVNRRRVEQLTTQLQPLTQLPLLVGYSGTSLEEAAEYAQLGAGVLLEDLAIQYLEQEGEQGVARLLGELDGLRTILEYIL